MADPEPETAPETQVQDPPPAPRGRPSPQVNEGPPDTQPKTDHKERWEVRWRNTINKAALAGLGTAITAGTGAPVHVPWLFAGGGAVGKMVKGGKSLHKILDETLVTAGAVGTILPGMIELWNATYPLFNTNTTIGKAALAAYTGVPFNAAFVSSYNTVNHAYENNFDMKGLGNHLKEHMVPDMKRFAWAFPAYYAHPYMPEIQLPTEVPLLGDTISTYGANAAPLSFYNAVNPPKTTSERLEAKMAKAQQNYTAEKLEPNPEYQKQLANAPVNPN